MSTQTPLDLRELYDLALDLDPAERTAWLRAHCPDAGLRARVQRLLEATGGDVDPLALSPRERIAALESPALPAREIGGFRLLRPIGQGGMATVWLAERTGFAQRVALKLLHRTLIGDLDRQLFERERRVLAALEHPNIARLIDGGVDSNQQPWLAMEYVEGENLLAYAQRRQLSPRERVALLLEACEAVAAAHAQLVVHRDLKPGNVLVGSDGRIKLLDFGIAKVLGDEADLTTSGFAAFTPAYAAPEQLCAQPISTATDVYALGVMAIELLLGLRPADLQKLAPSQQVLRIPAEDQAARTTRRSLVRFLRGDLDNVLRRCLDEDPRRRYPGAQALADDLRRFLSDQPVAAHPPSRWYLVRKFARRHRGGVIATALLSLATVASLVLALWMGGQAREQALAAQAAAEQAQAERTRADAALKVSESTEGFINELFAAAIPPLGGGQAPSARDVLLKAEGQVELKFAESPEAAVRLYGRLALIHALSKSDADQRRLLQKARKLAQARLPADSEVRREAEFREATDRARENDPAALQEMREMVAATPDDDWSYAALSRRSALGDRLTIIGEIDEGLALSASTIVPIRTQCERGIEAHCRILLSRLQGLTLFLFGHGRLSDARSYGEQAVAEARRRYGEGRELARALGALAMVEERMGAGAEAKQHLDESAELLRRAGGSRAADLDATDGQTANLLWDSGRLLEAIAVRERQLAREPADEAQRRWQLWDRVTHASALQQAGRYRQALDELERARAPLEADREANRSVLARLHMVRAHIAAERDGDTPTAVEESRKALALLREESQPNPMQLAQTLLGAHRVATLSGPNAQAEPWLAELRELMSTIPEPHANLRRGWLLRQAQAALAAGDPAGAERLRQQLLADLADENPHAGRDQAQLLGLQIAAARGQPALADPAWLDDVESRRGADSRLVRDAQAFRPR